MHGHAKWQLPTPMVDFSHLHTYIYINVMHACVHAHLRIHGSKNLDQWAAQQQGQQSSAARQRISLHFAVKCRLHTQAHKRTYSCAACRTGCSRNLTQKKKQRRQRHRLQPRLRRSAAHS